jgi:hypothetical protein
MQVACIILVFLAVTLKKLKDKGKMILIVYFILHTISKILFKHIMTIIRNVLFVIDLWKST